VRAKYLLLFATIFLFNSINVTGGGERKPFSYYEVIIERNIFRSPFARPKEDKLEIGEDNLDLKIPTFPQVEEKKALPAKIVEVKEEPSSCLILTGIVLIEDTPSAVIENTKSQKGYYVKEGDLIEDFKVTKIGGDRVILQRGKEREELVMVVTSLFPEGGGIGRIQEKGGSEEKEMKEEDLKKMEPSLQQFLRMGK